MRRRLLLAFGASLPLAPACLLAASSCSKAPLPATVAPGSVIPQTLSVTATRVDRPFVTEDHFIASLEMQLSGEPFVETMGRALTGFSRDALPTDLYFDPALDGGARVDVAGFSSGVESYEYSKQPMNNVAFESGAGTSLAFGPLLNPAGATGADALGVLRTWVQHVAHASNATSRFVHEAVTPDNPLGWPGFWPTLEPYVTFDPTIQASSAVSGACSITSDDDPTGAGGQLESNDFECDYTSLHLADRASQITPTIGPGATGWTSWKNMLWVLNYLQVLHDSVETGVSGVPASQLAQVGAPGNTIVGTAASTSPPAPIAGTFLGSSDIEGFQAGNFIQIVDNQAEEWLTQLTTTDGATLGGFASINEALDYTVGSPLRWFPSAIAVTETDDASGFPLQSAYAVQSPDSDLLDLAGLLGAFATAYSLTDTGNAQVGGSQPVVAYFDGDPFPADDQLADGEPTLHDRSLAMIRVLVVNLARLHVDPSTQLFLDGVALGHGSPVRGKTLSTDKAAYALLALRTARRSLDSQLVLYSNTKPDTEGVPTPLDALQPLSGLPFGVRLDQLVRSLSNTFYDLLTTADGHAYGGWSLATGGPVDDGRQLDAHTAAIRGLLVAYLATGETKFRDRAAAVFARLDAAFYDPAGRVYHAVEGDGARSVTFTPRRFALLQAALRDVYELIGVNPGQGALASLVLDRVGRLNKLVLDGWDDRDQDGVIQYPTECILVTAGVPGGGLQMAERTLTGELGFQGDGPPSVPLVIVGDRNSNCVPNVAAAGLPAALASSITLTLTAMTP